MDGLEYHPGVFCPTAVVVEDPYTQTFSMALVKLRFIQVLRVNIV
jgi:hypothetical protein